MTSLTPYNGAATAIAPINPLDGFELLGKYEAPAVERPAFIATVSAGFKNKEGTPQASRDGTIHLSDPDGRAPGLAEALAATDGKTLLITLPSDDFRSIFFQHFRKEGRSRLEAFGDRESITVIGTDGTRTVHAAGTPGYQRIVEDKGTKVSYELAFFLARWNTESGTPRPDVLFPDGVGAYRLRSTSRKSAENLIACVRQLATLTGGPVAGFPLEVRLTYPQVADPTGAKRSPPIFVFTFKLPGGMALGGAQFRSLAVESAAVLPSMAIAQLPAAPTIDEVVAEFELLKTPMDANECRKGFFGVVKGTKWASDEGRAEFFREFTEGRTDSFKAWLESATTDDMHALLDYATDRVAELVDGVDVSTGEVITVDAEVVTDDDTPAPPADDSNEAPTAEQIARCGELVKALKLSPAAGKTILRDKFEKEGRSELTRGEMAQFIQHLDGLAKASQKEEGDA